MAKNTPPPDIESFNDILKEVENESDRGSALITSSWVDDALTHYIRKHFVTDKKIDTELFTGTAPLAAFSAKIKVAYYARIIGPNLRNDLDAIRNIRNEYAHYRNALSYDDAPVCDFIGNLTTPDELRQWGMMGLDSKRDEYIVSALVLALYFMHVTADDAEVDPQTDGGIQMMCKRFSERAMKSAAIHMLDTMERQQSDEAG